MMQKQNVRMKHPPCTNHQMPSVVGGEAFRRRTYSLDEEGWDDVLKPAVMLWLVERCRTPFLYSTETGRRDVESA
jgi:hypothetical protein